MLDIVIHLKENHLCPIEDNYKFSLLPFRCMMDAVAVMLVAVCGGML